MKNLLPLFLLLITLHDAMAVTVCSVDHPVSDGPAGCIADPGCQPVYYTNGGFFRCIPNCFDNSLNSQDACENYAGCEWNIDGGGCLFFDGTTATPAQYKTRIGDGIQTQDCPSDHPNITNIADSEEFCYKPCATDSDTTTTCGFSNDGQGDAVSCLDASSQIFIYANDYHAEGDSCYLNTRPCNLFSFTVQGISSPDSTHVNGSAIWENDQYTTSGCTYEDTTVLNDTLHCKQAVSYHGGQTAINANATISYASGSGSSYYCQSCENKEYYPTTDKPNEYHNCSNNPSGTTKACSCIKIEVGYYNSCSNGWSNNMTLNQCHSRCPIGQTTSGEGSTDISACQYKDDTQICDGDGTHCVTLNSVISGADANTWTSMLP